MYLKTSVLSSRRVGHERRCTSSFLSVAKNDSATALMLLYLSSGSFGLVGAGRRRSRRLRSGVECVVDLAGEVAFEATDDLALGLAFCGAAGDVVDGGLVKAHADDH